MSGVSPAIQNWSINTSIMQLRSMMSRLTITDDYIRRYVVSPDEGRRMEDERSRRQRANEATNAKPPQPPLPPSTENSLSGNNMVHVTPANGPTVEVCVCVKMYLYSCVDLIAVYRILVMFALSFLNFYFCSIQTES